MPDTVTEFDALDELIDALGAVGTGSRTLDVRIEYCLGIAFGGHVDVAGMLINEGVSWDTVSETLDRRVPPYTTSLDAAIEGENIEFVVRSAKRGQWGAMHRTRHLQEALAWAATEPLARRMAALKGWRDDLLKDRERREREQAAEPPAPLPQQAPAPTPAFDEAADAAEETRDETPSEVRVRTAPTTDVYSAAGDDDVHRIARQNDARDSPRRFATLPADDAEEPEEQDWKVLF